MKFRSGQQLICTNKEGWLDFDTGFKSEGPKFNEQVTFHRWYDSEFIVVKEYRFCTGDYEEDSYHKDFFEPLITDSQLEEELNTIEQTV